MNNQLDIIRTIDDKNFKIIVTDGICHCPKPDFKSIKTMRVIGKKNLKVKLIKVLQCSVCGGIKNENKK